jgi:hypothetical protein
MGILSEAQAMSALTGKPLQDCKRARRALDAEIRTALRDRRGDDPAQVMCEVAFGQLDTAVSSATTKGAQPVAETKGMPEPDAQVQDPAPEAQAKSPGWLKDLEDAKPAEDEAGDEAEVAETVDFKVGDSAGSPDLPKKKARRKRSR